VDILHVAVEVILCGECLCPGDQSVRIQHNDHEDRLGMSNRADKISTVDLMDISDVASAAAAALLMLLESTRTYRHISRAVGSRES
jgi:ligand-binding sensor protein